MAAAQPDYQPGQVLPGTKYTVVKELGAGGMGVVYQVVKPPQIQGVLKLMSPDLAVHEEFRRRFLDEVRILAQLDHPNIIKVSDYDQLADGTPFYVMELLTGRTVRDVLATIGRVPPRVAFEVIRQLCEALHCAHTHTPSVVHRDIKPENIFLHAPRHGDPVVKLIDFGVVAIADRAHDGTFVGTWKYAAPEQIRGERATPATDIYAVGLVLYEMLAGMGPFDHVDTGQLISQAHLREPPAPVSKFAPWVPKSIVDLISAALAKDPLARPPDAYVFAERLFELEWANDGQNPHDHTAEGPLSSVLSSVESATPPPSVPQIAASPKARHKGPTLPGVGGGDDGTAPDEDELLAALVARPDVRVPSRRSSPRGTPLPHPVVVRPGGDSAPRSPTAVTEDAASSHRDTDTFASQQSDARRGPGRGRASRVLVPIVLGALLLVGAGTFAVMKSRGPAADATRPVNAGATAPSPVTSDAPPAAQPLVPASARPVVVEPTAPVASAATPAPSPSPTPTHAATTSTHATTMTTPRPTATPKTPPPPRPTVTSKPTATPKDDGYLRSLQ